MSLFLKRYLSRRENIFEAAVPPPVAEPQAAVTAVPTLDPRTELAFGYLCGEGLEIGALHSSLPVPACAKVRYVDRMSTENLRKQYPELAEQHLVEPDIIDDGEILSSVADASLDFVIANHMIEHCQNPIATIQNHLRVLRPDGVLYMAVPDKRYTFDQDRPVTPLEHVVRDYREGPGWSREAHYEEYVRLVDKVGPENVRQHAQYLMGMDYSIHFHVWTQFDFLRLLDWCRSNLPVAFDIEAFRKNSIEFIAVLRVSS